MRHHTQQEIRVLESSNAYRMDIFEGWSDGKGGDTLLLESVQDDVIGAFGGTKKEEKKTAESNNQAVLSAFRGEEFTEAVHSSKPAAEQDSRDIWNAFKGTKEEETINEASRQAILDACHETPEKFKATMEQIDELKEAFGGGKPLGAEELQEAQLFGPIMLESVSVDEITESSGKPFRFKGKALKTDRINQNNRRYSGAITQKALQEYRASGQRLSIMSGHPKKGDTDPSNVVGSVALGDVDTEGWLRYEGTLSDTSKGLDLQRLLRDRAIGDVSLRSRGHTAIKQVDGKVVEDVIDLHFKGLDLVISGSETGAGVEQILNAN